MTQIIQKSRLLFVFAVSSIFLSSALWGGDNPPLFKEVKTDTEISKAQTDEVLQEINTFIKNIGLPKFDSKTTSLKAPANLILHLHRKARENFDKSTSTINIAYGRQKILMSDLDKPNTYSFSFEQSKAILFHEFSHAVFSDRLRSDFPEYVEYLDALIYKTSLKTKKNNLHKEYSLVSESLTHAETEEFKEKLQTIFYEYNAVKYAFAELREENRWVDASDTMYNEMFADLAAILGSKNNPKAMYNVYVQEGMQKDKPDYVTQKIGRDFSHPQNSIETWSPDKSSGSHTDLAPVRYHIFHNMIQQHDFTAPKSKYYLLEFVYQCIASELRYRLDNPDLDLPIKKWNERLIEKLNAFSYQNIKP